jgi:uncharacterized protein (TIRG00374 family)
VFKRTLIARILSVAHGFAGLYLVAGGTWFSSFVLFWLLLTLYGVEADLLATISALSSVTLVSHVVPTPGESGFVESVVEVSIGTRTGGHAAAALLIWRLASFYAIFLLGPAVAWLLYLSHPAATGTNRPDNTTRI